MYRETKATIATVLVTAIIVGVGIHWYYTKYTKDLPENKVTPEEEVITVEPEVTIAPEPIVEGTPPAETVFDPKTFYNKISKYYIDHPKNWYWHHYGINQYDKYDYAAFDTASLSETLGNEYVGKVVIMVKNSPEAEALVEEKIAENTKWLNNVTLEIYSKEDFKIRIQRGEMENDELQIGSSNVRINAYIVKGNTEYSIGIAGPTPEEEKIFMQMVASFRFEE